MHTTSLFLPVWEITSTAWSCSENLLKNNILQSLLLVVSDDHSEFLVNFDIFFAWITFHGFPSFFWSRFPQNNSRYHENNGYGISWWWKLVNAGYAERINNYLCPKTFCIMSAYPKTSTLSFGVKFWRNYWNERKYLPSFDIYCIHIDVMIQQQTSYFCHSLSVGHLWARDA